MKKVQNFANNFALRSDLFAAAPTLRYNGEPAYQTRVGGCLSILMVIAFIFIFYSSFLDVLQKVNVISSVDVEDDPYDQDKIEDLKMAVGIDGIDFSDFNRYFDIILVQITQSAGVPRVQTVIPLQSCQYDDWKDEGQHFDKLFNIFEMEKMLCLKQGYDLRLQGFTGSDVWEFLEIRVEQCVNVTTEWQCHTPGDISAFITNHLTTQDNFKVKLFFSDTIVSPQNDPYIKKVLQTQNFVSFGQTTGTRGAVKIAKYNVTTDQSIWPIDDYKYETGHYISDFDAHTIQLHSTHYVKVQIQKSRKIFYVERQHEKLDDMLSYAGGLFSLIFAFFFFFLGSYAQCRYEMAVAQSSFAMDETGRKIGQHNFGFGTFLQYALYDWLRTLGISVRWNKIQQINKAKQEANEQMDIRLLMKKIQRFQRINLLLLEQHNLICSNLTRHPSINQVKKMRKIIQYYDKVIKHEQQQQLINLLTKVGDKRKVGPQKTETNKRFAMLQPIKEDCAKHQEETLEDEQKVDEQQLSDFDSEDEAAEKQILLAVQALQRKEKDCKMSRKILQNIPGAMKARLIKKKNEKKQMENDNGLEFLFSRQLNLQNQSDLQLNVNVGKIQDGE